MRAPYILTALAAGVASTALAQVSIVGGTGTRRPGASLTLTAQAAGTVRSPAQAGTGNAVTCIYNQASHTGTPSVTFAIEAVVPPVPPGTASAPMLTSAAITTDVASTLIVSPDVTTSANVRLQAVVPTYWDVAVTVGGTTPAVTGTVNCTTS